ncbi:hypothetical protein ACROYT_G043495 [Oculina patagonica]
MNNIVEIIQTISIGLIVVDFLIKTCRVPKAIDLCKECLFILDKTPLIKEKKKVKLVYKDIYLTMLLAYRLLDDCTNAIKYATKILPIFRECSERLDECRISLMLAALYLRQSKSIEAKEHSEIALLISTEIGHKNGEAICNESLGLVYQSVGEYKKAKEHHKRALTIKKEIGDRKGESSSYTNLGTAKKYLEVGLAIKKEISDRQGEASCYGNLGNVFESVGEHVKAKEYYEKALAIRREIGDRKGEGAVCGNLGTVFLSLGKYAKANEYLQKALALSREIGDKNVEAAVYENLRIVYKSIGDHEKGREHLDKALTVSKETGNREREASICASLGTVLEFLGKYVEAEEYYKRALAISEEIGEVKIQSTCLFNLGWVMILTGKIQQALSYLLPSIQKCEKLRGFLRENDQFKISFSHEHCRPHQVLTAFFCVAGNPNQALHVSELSRARALADLMSAQYSVENQISANPQSWVGIESVMDKELSCTCLYLYYFDQDIFLWILKARGVVHFRRADGKEMIVREGLVENLDEFFSNEHFRGFGILPEEHCEDRSLNDIERNPCEEDLRKTPRIGNEGKDNQDFLRQNLSLCHNLIIAPVVDLIEGPEIIIVPDRSLYNIPFAALPDECGKYLSEIFRIRVVPSLTTLKLIQDSPADYHSQTGALIVGNPDVGRVRYKGRLKCISRLPCAENEANMIGEKLGVKPFLGQQATKQAVLEVINSVSLIHFAAHGDAERGEIALAPLRTLNRIPQEEDFLLTMSDISKIQLRAKLVVLSCCHSGRGQIKTEGVVGIARAFLGSGARSVLVALWALEDSATEQFMSRFYEHLVGGDSASESLHEAMKWMRCNGYSKVRQWAPFMLIGDNMTFDFGKSK